MKQLDSSKKIENSNEYKNLLKNSIYSFFHNFSSIFFQIIIPFLIARLITIESWGVLILSISFISLFAVITKFFPPALEYSIIYYIPRFISLEENKKLRSFIKNVIILKFLFLLLFYFCFLFLFFNIIEKIWISSTLLFILSPLIIFSGFNIIFYSILRGFNRFKSIFLIFLFSSFFKISLLFIMFSELFTVKIEYIAFIYVINEIIPFLVCLIYIFNIVRKLTKEEGFDKTISLKEVFKMTSKYGFPISFGYLIYGLWDQIQILGIGNLTPIENVTGYNISLGYSKNLISLSSSLSMPLIRSFTNLNVSNQSEKIKKIYNLVIKLKLFFLSIMVGIFFYLSDFFLLFIYGSNYENFSIFLKLMLISIIFNVIQSPADALVLAKKKQFYITIIRLIMVGIYTSLFFLFLIFFGIIGSFFAIIFSNILIFIMYFIVSYRFLVIEIDLKKLIFQYFSFFIALIISIFLNSLFLEDLSMYLLNLFNLSFFNSIPILTILIFIILYLVFTSLFRFFKKDEIEYFQLVLNIKKFSNRIIIKTLSFIKKFVR